MIGYTGRRIACNTRTCEWPRETAMGEVNGRAQAPPSFYFRRNVVGTFQDDPVTARERHTIGPEGMMWLSDYPHSDSTWPASQAVIAYELCDVPPDEKRLILGGNAATLYGFS
jgi:hypothetical protein